MTSNLLPQLPQPKVSGLMQESPLLISSLIEHAATNHGDREIVSRMADGSIHRSNYRQAANRSRQLANALTKDFGITEGDVIGTLAFNHIFHVECYYGSSGIGAILHTINPRLFPEQLEYIINHAEDRLLFIDVACSQIFGNFIKQGKKVNVQRIILLCDEQMFPKLKSSLQSSFPSDYTPEFFCYESVIGKHSTEFQWPVFHEFAASSLCYTSGTTGNPKGVLYSHRSTLLHAFSGCSADVLGVASDSALLVIVPMFHANAWGLVYNGCMAGAKLILPGHFYDGPKLTELIVKEEATSMLGVPTVFLAIQQHWQQHDVQTPSLKKVGCGGSAMPPEMIRYFLRRGAQVLHAWGMTETSPVGTSGTLIEHKHKNLSEDELVKLIAKQGRQIYGVDMRIVNPDTGEQLPRDGKQMGEVQVRGNWITRGYYKLGKPNVDENQYFSTGDVATIDPEGYMQITDRSKDVIKSGGEWISSIDIENIVTGHPKVSEACVIGHKHTKWQERPLLLVVKKPGQDVSEDEIKEYLTPKIAKWWMPNGIVFVKELPHTATGKLSKLQVRQQFRDYIFPDDPQEEQKEATA